jgi:hypothetical protein
MAINNPFYKALKSESSVFNSSDVTDLFALVDEERASRIAEDVSLYLRTNLPKAFDRRKNLDDYRTNPYVLLTSASVLDLDDPDRFADFIFNSKFYMALETSFGKSIEAAFPRTRGPGGRTAPERMTGTQRTRMISSGTSGHTNSGSTGSLRQTGPRVRSTLPSVAGGGGQHDPHRPA